MKNAADNVPADMIDDNARFILKMNQVRDEILAKVAQPGLKIKLID